MTQLHDLRLRLLVQQESEQIARSHPKDMDLALVQARCLCWLSLLAEAHEDQANDAERRGDTEQAMGWFADSMRLQDVIQIVTSVEMPYHEFDSINTSSNGSLEFSSITLEKEFKKFCSSVTSSQIHKISNNYEKDRADILIEEYLKLLNRELKREMHLKLQLALELEGKAMAIVDHLRREARIKSHIDKDAIQKKKQFLRDNFNNESPLAA